MDYFQSLLPRFMLVDYARRVTHWRSHVGRWRWSALEAVELIRFNNCFLSRKIRLVFIRWLNSTEIKHPR